MNKELTIISQQIKNAKGNYHKYNEYYVIVKDIPNSNIVISNNKRYYLKYKPLANKSYVSFYDVKCDHHNFLLALLYSKINGEWKLRNLDFNIKRVSGKSIFTLYSESKKLVKEGYYMSGVLRTKIINLMLNPTPYFHYKKEEEIKKFIKKSKTKIDEEYKFPIKLSKISSKPEIYSLDFKTNKKGNLVPVIYYHTKINLNKVDKIKVETKKITRLINNVFSGLTKVEKGIIYKAYSSPPIYKDKKYYYMTIDINFTE